MSAVILIECKAIPGRCGVLRRRCGACIQTVFLRSLTNLSIAFTRAIKSLKSFPIRRAIVDIFSPATSTYDFDTTNKFIHTMAAKLREANFTTLFFVDKEMHDSEQLASIHSLFDIGEG